MLMVISSQNVNSTGCTQFTIKHNPCSSKKIMQTQPQQHSHGQTLITVFPLFLIYVTYDPRFLNSFSCLLFISQILCLSHALPLQVSPAARAQKGYSCHTNNGHQAAEQSPSKILHCSIMSFKTLVANPFFSLQPLYKSRLIFTLIAKYLTPNSSNILKETLRCPC